MQVFTIRLNICMSTTPETALAIKITSPQTTAETGLAQKVLPVISPETAQAVHTPLLTPLGVHPHFQTPTLDVPLNYGTN
jgi:hypothetical protein